MGASENPSRGQVRRLLRKMSSHLARGAQGAKITDPSPRVGRHRHASSTSSVQ